MKRCGEWFWEGNERMLAGEMSFVQQCGWVVTMGVVFAFAMVMLLVAAR